MFGEHQLFSRVGLTRCVIKGLPLRYETHPWEVWGGGLSWKLHINPPEVFIEADS